MLLKGVRNWLERRLSLIIPGSTDLFLQNCVDGVLIGQILENYDIITLGELQSIYETQDPEIAQEQFASYVRPWLQRLDINLSDTDIFEITHGEGTASVTVFYELYLRLEDKAKQKSEIAVKPKKHIFTVANVEDMMMEDVKFIANPLCEPLIKQWDVINWEKDHLTSLMMKYNQSREEYDHYLEEKQSRALSIQEEYIEYDKLVSKGHSNDYTYEELIALQYKALNMEPFKPDPDEAKRILNKIKKKHKNDIERNNMKIQLQQDLLNQINMKLKREEEIDFDKTVSQKLVTQSQYEKELAEKLLKIRNHKNIIAENRKKADDDYRRKQDEEFIRRIMEEELEERLRYREEQQELINLHKQLYEEKLAKKKLKHEKICRDIMADITDLAIKNAEYRKQFGFEPCRYLKNDWANLFIKQQKILDDIPDLYNDKSMCSFSDFISPSSGDLVIPELKRIPALDEEDFLDYIHWRNFWEIHELGEDYTQYLKLGLNVIGYIVHKLLLKKYPLPLPDKAKLSPQIEISVCVSNIIEEERRINYLQRLLELKSVKVVKIEDAVAYCIAAYEKERKTEFDEPFPEDLKEITPRVKDKKGAKKGKKDKKAKKDKSKSSKKGKKDKHQHKTEEVAAPITDDKQAQTPRLFPWEYLELSNKARLGKIAKAQLEIGDNHKIDDKYLVEMFIEYLLSLDDSIKGWVLLNYPNNYEQAALLEQALTGKPVPKQYFDKIINQESLESVNVDNIAASERLSSNLSIMAESTPSHNSAEEEQGETEQQSLTIVDHPRETSDTIIDHSSVEFITIDDNIQLPQERMTKLLPDLISLVYSNDNSLMFKSEIDDNKVKPCACVAKMARDLVEIEEKECACYNLSPDTDSSVKKSRSETEIEGVPVIIDENIEGNNCEIDEEAPVGCVEIIDDKPRERDVREDIYEDKRISKIVPNPRPLEKEIYNTILTAFIKVIEKEDDESDDDKLDNPYLKKLERLDGLEKFYCDQGCYYLLEYQEFTSDTIKCLAKMIIGDYSLPLKSSIEIFGERYLEAKFEVGDHVITKKGKGTKKDKKKKNKPNKKKDKSKSDVATKKSKKDKSSKSSKKSKGKDKKSKKGGKKGKKAAAEPQYIPTFEDKESQIPIEEEEVEIIEPKPGEDDYEYIDFAIPEDIFLNLANFWDDMEAEYVRNFKDLFWNKRVILYNFGPYIAHLKKSMAAFLERPDQKQYFLHEFQKTLNEIDLELRSDEDTKQELFCNIEEFRQKLLAICDDKMRESEEERQKFIRQNWIFNQLMEFANNISTAFQFELSRFVDTVSLINLYYSAMIFKEAKQYNEIPEEEVDKLIITDIDKIERFNSIFIDLNDNDLSRSPFSDYINDSLCICLKYIDTVKDDVWLPHKETHKIFEIKPDKDKKKAKKHKDKKSDKKKGAKAFEPDEDIKDNSDKIFDEWEYAIEGEFARVNAQLNLIKEESLRRLRCILAWIRDLLGEIFKSISERYKREIECVNTACEILQISVKDEMIIKPELSFDGDRLEAIKIEIIPNVNESHDDILQDTRFKIEQLEFMVDVLLDLARDGYILEKTFLLLLQDMTYQDNVAPLWRNLPIKTLQKILSQLFDDIEYIYWKDFVICNLMLGFPTSQDLQDIRSQFRDLDLDSSEIITKQQFDSVIFWFEYGETDWSFYKSIIFKMYQVGVDQFNYSAMLLDFCKDRDNLVGFAKALELSLGRLICYDQTLGDNFVENVMRSRAEFEAKLQRDNEIHEETVEIAKKAVSVLIDTIIHQCESATLTELPQTDQFSGESSQSSALSRLSSDNRFMTEDKYTERDLCGTEALDNTNLVHFLPFDLIVMVLKTAIPWCLKVNAINSAEDESEEGEIIYEQSFLDKVAAIYEECRNDKFNGAVLAHEFLNNDNLKSLFELTHKFSAKNPVKIVKSIVETYNPYVLEEADGEEEEMCVVESTSNSFMPQIV